MKYIDISKTIFSGMEKYPSDPDFSQVEFKSLEKGSSCNLTIFNLPSHCGTHIDAPLHVLTGSGGVDSIALEDLICKVSVVDPKALSNEKIFEEYLGDSKGILLKDEAILTRENAQMLIENNVRVVGTGALSIEDSSDKDHPVHKILLSNKVVIVENLDLKEVECDQYTLICLPLKIKGADGCPVRVVLMHD